jgi:hypothetical protein
MGRYVRLAMRGAVAKSYEVSWAAAHVAAVNAGEYALRRVRSGSVVDCGGMVLGTADNHGPRGRSGTGNKGGCGIVRVNDDNNSPTKLWYYMVGGGQGGPIVIPHPDNDNAGSTNANDNNNAPPPPPKNNGDAPRREGNGTTTVPDNNAMAAVASRDAAATNAMSAVGCWGARNLRAVADGMGGFMIMSLISYDRRVGSGCARGLDGGRGAGQQQTIMQQ